MSSKQSANAATSQVTPQQVVNINEFMPAPEASEPVKSRSINLCGLWLQRSKTGITYLSGSLGRVKVLIFPNKGKALPEHPDFTVVLSERLPKVETEKNGFDALTGIDTVVVPFEEAA